MPAALGGGVALGGRERDTGRVCGFTIRIPQVAEAPPRGIPPLRKPKKEKKREKSALLEWRRRRSFCAGRKADSQVGSHPSGRCPKQFGPGLPNLEAQSQSSKLGRHCKGYRVLIVAEQTCEDDGKLIKLMPPAEPAETNTAAAYLLMSIPKGRMQLTPGGIRGVWAQGRWGNVTSHADDGSASAGRGGGDPITQSKPISVALFAHPGDLQAGRVSQDQIAELIWVMANISEAWSPGSNDLPAQ